MAENSKIEWTTHTFNPWIGCEKVAPGCTHCYAEAFAKRTGGAKWGAGGTRIKTSAANWAKPLKWNKQAECLRTFDCANGDHSDACPQKNRPRVFCASLADVFEDWRGAILDHKGNQLLVCCTCGALHAGDAASDQESCQCGRFKQRMEWASMEHVRRELFKLIDATPNLDWLVLTKRPENIRRMLVPYSLEKVAGHVSQNEGDGRRIIKRRNLWLGTSISEQATADGNVPHLLACRDLSPVLFLSAEPLLGEVSLANYFPSIAKSQVAADQLPYYNAHFRIDWVIVGGESGHHSRPMHPDWVRSLRDQCQATGVPFLFKQWGEYRPFGEVSDWDMRGVATKDRIFVEQSGAVSSSPNPDDTSFPMLRVGKVEAGRQLDGVVHNKFPRVELDHV